jgi:hypothetical protein
METNPGRKGEEEQKERGKGWDRKGRGRGRKGERYGRKGEGKGGKEKTNGREIEEDRKEREEERKERGRGKERKEKRKGKKREGILRGGGSQDTALSCLARECAVDRNRIVLGRQDIQFHPLLELLHCNKKMLTQEF